MFGNSLKKVNPFDVSCNSIAHVEEDNSIIHLTYVKVPLTLEVRKRQHEEQLREKYNIPKVKSGILL